MFFGAFHRKFNMKNFLFSLLLILLSVAAQAQKPADGIYIYQIAFAEWNDKSLGSTVNVIIKGDTIKVIANNKTRLSQTKSGDIIDQGIIMKHGRTGLWIIGHSPNDRNAKDVGGCSDGPQVIDFKHKKFRIC